MFLTPLYVDLESLCVEFYPLYVDLIPLCVDLTPHITKPLFAKMPIFRDNPHKTKAIFNGGFRGGAVYEKCQ